MRKILYFITQSEYGGAQRYVFDLANNLKTDFQVAVVMGEQGNSGKLAKILQKNNIEYFIIPHLKRSISPLNEILALREIIKLIKKYQPDIIHLNSSKISILGSIAAFLIRIFAYSRHSHYSQISIIYTVHGWVFNEPLPVWLKYFYLFSEKFTAGFKDKIICVSEYDKQLALKHKIAPANKLVTIHNGLSAIEFYDKQKAKELLFKKIENRKSKIENILVGSIGHLYKTKGYEYLIEAAHILMADPSFPRKRESRFVIIGDGSERKNLENLIKKYNLKNNFILAGRIDEAARLLNAFDIYVCSSVKEGFPYSVLEAMAAGLPIVATAVGGIPEMVEHKKTGLLTKPAEARQLAEKIKKLIEQPIFKKNLGEQAKINVAAKFNLQKMVAETKKVYK